MSAIPEEIMREARAVARASATLNGVGRTEIIARALMARDQRAAGIAREWLETWGYDLQATCDDYRDAMASGQMNGRRIPVEMARAFASQFKERAEAVHACGEHVAAAITTYEEPKP